MLTIYGTQNQHLLFCEMFKTENQLTFPMRQAEQTSEQ